MKKKHINVANIIRGGGGYMPPLPLDPTVLYTFTKLPKPYPFKGVCKEKNSKDQNKFFIYVEKNLRKLNKNFIGR